MPITRNHNILCISGQNASLNPDHACSVQSEGADTNLSVAQHHHYSHSHYIADGESGAVLEDETEEQGQSREEHNKLISMSARQ